MSGCSSFFSPTAELNNNLITTRYIVPSRTNLFRLRGNKNGKERSPEGAWEEKTLDRVVSPRMFYERTIRTSIGPVVRRKRH